MYASWNRMCLRITHKSLASASIAYMYINSRPKFNAEIIWVVYPTVFHSAYVRRALVYGMGYAYTRCRYALVRVYNGIPASLLGVLVRRTRAPAQRTEQKKMQAILILVIRHCAPRPVRGYCKYQPFYHGVPRRPRVRPALARPGHHCSPLPTRHRRRIPRAHAGSGKAL